MTAKTRSQLKAENSADLPDNTTRQISPADIRGQMDDVADSSLFPEDLPGLDISQTVVTSSPGGVTQSIADWAGDITEGGTGSGDTVDTGEHYRIIMLANGTVRAVPFDTVPPVTPTGLAAVARLTSVTLTWNAVTGATQYRLTRNGVALATTTLLYHRDTTITISNTYEYRVAAVDTYGQRSPESDLVSAFIDPALNVPPTDVVITAWPLPLPTDGPALIRVNAWELDVHNVAFTLGVDAGALTATDDPSVWRLRI